MTYRDEQQEGGDDAELDDREAPDESDTQDGDEPEVVACPYCGRTVYEEAEICPHCGSFISAEDAPRRRPWWVVAGGLACVVVVLIWVFAHG